jgi:hypothetical protein
VLPDCVFGDLAADVDAGDAELLARSIVTLHEDANRIASCVGVEHAGTGSNPAFEVVADHTRAAANIAFFDRA